MKKLPLKVHPLPERMQAFQVSPFFDPKTNQKGDENKLKKISRNRLPVKQPSLPAIKRIVDNKQNVQLPIHRKSLRKERSYHKSQCKNMSFFKLPSMQMQLNKSKMSISQKLDSMEASKSKDPLKKQIFVRDKRMIVANRNCLSAQLKKQSNLLIINSGYKAKPRQVRRASNLRRAKQPKQEQQFNQIPVQMQAQRLAYQARVSNVSHPNNQQFFSLEDFLNQWKSINLP